jgi:hypothetical protein
MSISEIGGVETAGIVSKHVEERETVRVTKFGTLYVIWTE